MESAFDHEHDILFRYLLGELTPPEQEGVEERYMLDERYSELRDEAEADLVDAYVAGTLTETQRRHFEICYMITRQRREAVQTAYLIKVYRERIAQPAPRAPHTSGFLPRRFKMMIPATAAALVGVAISGVTWFIYQRWRGKHESPTAHEFNRPSRPASTAPGPIAQPSPAPESRFESRNLPRKARTGSTTGRHDAATGASRYRLQAGANPSPPPPSPIPDTSTEAKQGEVPPKTPGSGDAKDKIIAEHVPDTIQQTLVSRYPLTQSTEDNTDIVTTGAVLVLKKGNVIMGPVSSREFFLNTYKDGRITHSPPGIGIRGLGAMGRLIPGISALPVTRRYVPGGKMWATKIDVVHDGVVFHLLTDEVDDIRYHAFFKFTFPKGSTPTAEQVEEMVEEVFNVESAGVADDPQQPPASITLGQTIDEVTKVLGQPTKILDLGVEKIYFYWDIKITFSDGKVIEVQ